LPGQVCEPNLPSCPEGFTCQPFPELDRYLCIVVTCRDGDFTACPANTTCFPPTGPGECKPPRQVACTFIGPAGGSNCAPGICPSGQVCGTITVNRLGLPSTACGCVPQ